MPKEIKILLKKKYVLAGLSIFAVLLLVFFWQRSKTNPPDWVAVKRGNIRQEVSLTGQVKSTETIDLAFETSGQVRQVFFEVGQKVMAGQAVASLGSGELRAQLSQAEANLQTAQAQLDELKKGTRPEELESARTAVANAEKSLADSQSNLEAVQNKGQADLESAYNSALSASQKAAGTAKTSLLTLTDIQYNHSTILENSDVAEAKAEAVLYLLGVADAGKWTTSSLSGLSYGAFGQVQQAVSNPTQENTDLALSKVADALQKVKNSLDSMPVSSELTTTEKTSLSTEKANVAGEITVVDSKQQLILVQKTTNAYNLAVARSGINTSQNSLNTARDTLKLKEAGATPEQVAAQEARVESASSARDVVQAQLNKTVMISPINGTLVERSVQKSESVTPGKSVVSLISDQPLQLEAKIPEVDIAKIKVNNVARVTLDAFGSDRVLTAEVVRIDPSEVLVEGVPTYRVVLEFTTENQGVLTGMTANLDIQTAQKDNVLFLPQRVVYAKNGGKFVRVLEKNNQIEEMAVQTGLRGSSGEVEIVEGLQEGDRVLLSTK